MLDIKLFERPTHPPYGMLRDFKNVNECEKILAYMLAVCIDAGEFKVVDLTDYRYWLYEREMLNQGLLRRAGTGEHEYKLTTKSIGLLLSVYGREEL